MANSTVPQAEIDYSAYRPEKSNQIHRVGGYHKSDGYMYYPVVIVGAGESGIAMGHKLKVDLGFDQFRIFERQSGIGGTWWINRYPGVTVDVPAVFYSFSFATNPRWSAFFPEGPEIYAYLQDVCDRFKFTDKIQLNTDVSVCKWLKNEELWEITLHHMVPGMGDLSSKERSRKMKEEGEASVCIASETIRAKVLISAVGGIVEPRSAPDNVPGFPAFKGEYFHSARWDYNVDFNGKDVVVLGTGCSAAQFCPKLTKAPYNAKSVTQLMRSPPWVVDRQKPPGGDKNWRKWAPRVFSNVPGTLRLLRYVIATKAEWDWRLFGTSEFSGKERKNLEAELIEHMKKTVPEKYHEILTPNYSVCCKRRIFDATWFPGLNDEKIELTTLPLTAVHERSVTLGPGRMYPDSANTDSKAPTEEREIPADVIVLANGYDVTRWLHPLTVLGTEGQDIVDTMQERGGPQAYQGTAMDGFPNFFIIYGPNTTTGHSSVIMATENMVQYAAKFIKPILNGDVKTVEVKKEAEVAYTVDIQKQLKKTVFMSGGCSSWYYDKAGWNSTVLPYNQVWFWYRCTFPYWNHWNIKYTRKGMVKLVLLRSVKLLAIVATLLSFYRARQQGMGLADYLRNLLRSVIATAKMVLATGVDVAQNALQAVKDGITQ